MAARRQLTDPPAGSVPRRGRRATVLEVLRRADGPLGAAEVGERVGVHLNTARFHLDALVGDGLAVRDTAPRDEPGRPKVVYAAAVTGAADASRSFRLLSDILLGIVSSSVDDPVAAATRAGQVWGSYLAEAPPPSVRLSAEEGERRLVATLEDMGFTAEPAEPDGPSGPDGPTHPAEPADHAEPAAPAGPDGPVSGTATGEVRRLRLYGCPFREVAQQRPDIVCAIHLGLLRGTLETLRAPLAAEELEPFVTPHRCVATLRRTGTA